eukprot:1400420-Rhodomonas_salina.2
MLGAGVLKDLVEVLLELAEAFLRERRQPLQSCVGPRRSLEPVFAEASLLGAPQQDRLHGAPRFLIQVCEVGVHGFLRTNARPRLVSAPPTCAGRLTTAHIVCTLNRASGIFHSMTHRHRANERSVGLTSLLAALAHDASSRNLSGIPRLPPDYSRRQALTCNVQSHRNVCRATQLTWVLFAHNWVDDKGKLLLGRALDRAVVGGPEGGFGVFAVAHLQPHSLVDVVRRQPQRPSHALQELRQALICELHRLGIAREFVVELLGAHRFLAVLRHRLLGIAHISAARHSAYAEPVGGRYLQRLVPFPDDVSLGAVPRLCNQLWSSLQSQQTESQQPTAALPADTAAPALKQSSSAARKNGD